MTAIGRSISAVALLLALGCSSVPHMSGEYVGHRKVSVNPGYDAVQNQLERVDLTVRDNGDASLSDGGIPAEGRIEYGGSAATFTPDRIAGMSVDRQPPELVKQFTMPIKPLGKDRWQYPGGVILEKQR